MVESPSSPFPQTLGDKPAGTSGVNATSTIPHSEKFLGDTAVFASDSKEETIQAQESKALQQEPYSVFSRSDKWLIVSISTIASMFRFALKSFGTCTARLNYSNGNSPLTANIYFPVIPTLVVDFHKSTELINLTVTVYMIMQGIGMLLRLRVYVPSI